MATSKYTSGASHTISKGAQTYLGDYLKVFREKSIMYIWKPWYPLLMMEDSYKENSLFSDLSSSRPTGKKCLLQIYRALPLKWGGLRLALVSQAHLDKKPHECLQPGWACFLQPLSQTHLPSQNLGRGEATGMLRSKRKPSLRMPSPLLSSCRRAVSEAVPLQGK